MERHGLCALTHRNRLMRVSISVWLNSSKEENKYKQTKRNNARPNNVEKTAKNVSYVLGRTKSTVTNKNVPCCCFTFPYVIFIFRHGSIFTSKKKGGGKEKTQRETLTQTERETNTINKIWIFPRSRNWDVDGGGWDWTKRALQCQAYVCVCESFSSEMQNRKATNTFRREGQPGPIKIANISIHQQEIGMKGPRWNLTMRQLPVMRANGRKHGAVSC